MKYFPKPTGDFGTTLTDRIYYRMKDFAKTKAKQRQQALHAYSGSLQRRRPLDQQAQCARARGLGAAPAAGAARGGVGLAVLGQPSLAASGRAALQRNANHGLLLPGSSSSGASLFPAKKTLTQRPAMDQAPTSPDPFGGEDPFVSVRPPRGHGKSRWSPQYVSNHLFPTLSLSYSLFHSPFS